MGAIAPVELGLALDGLIQRLQVRDLPRWWPVPGPTDHKYTRGVVGLVTGSTAIRRSAACSAAGAYRTGAGMVRYVGPDDVARMVIGALPEVVPGSGRVQSWVLGCGVDPADPEQGGHVRDVLVNANVPTVVDAGALAILPTIELPSERRADLVLTPHAGEHGELLSNFGRPTERDEVGPGHSRICGWL